MAQRHETGPERLDAYRLAVEFYRALPGLAIPRGAGLSDQIARAASSVALNLAEGLGRSSRADRARFFEIAHGSALECSAVLDLVTADAATCGLVRRLVQTTGGLAARQRAGSPGR